MLVVSRKALKEIVVNNGDITISVRGITGEKGPPGRFCAPGHSRTSDGIPSSDHLSNQVRGGACRELRGAKSMIFRGPVRVIAGALRIAGHRGDCLVGVVVMADRRRNRPQPVPKRSPEKNYYDRKTTAMQAISDGMIRGDLRCVETTAKQLSAYGKAIQWYLSATAYEENGEKFQQSVDDLIAAAGKGDVNSAKEAVLRLERSCIDCHIVVNQLAR